VSKIIITVPCYNEASRLDAESFLTYLKKWPAHHFIFVDDGSTDQTWSVLERMQRRQPTQIQLLKLESNQGKAEAVRRGLLSSLQNSADVIGFWDADLATPLSEIEPMLACFSRAQVEIVMGSRVKLLGRVIERRALRHYLGRCFATVTSMVLNLAVYDTQCGAKLFKVTKGLPQTLQEPFSSRWIFDVELLARFQSLHKDAGERIYEFPLNVWRDVAGSKLKVRDFFTAIFELFQIYRHSR